MVALSPLWIAFALAAAVCGGGTRGGDDEEEEEEKRLLSDIKVCGDEDCSMWLYKVEAVRDYDAPDCHFVSFRTGDVLYVYHMLAGRRDDLWAGSAGLQFGYFPKDAVKVIFKEPSAKDIKKPTKFTDFMCLPSSHQNAKTSDDESHGNDDLHMGDVEPTLPQVKASGSENQMPRVPNEEENISKQHQVNGDTRTEKDSDMKSPEGDARVVTPQGQPSHVHGDGKPLPVLASHPKASEDKSRNDSEIASDPEVDAALFPAEHSEIGQGTLNVESPREASSVSNAYAIKKDVNALALKEDNLFSIESNEDEITPEDNASSDLPELQILLTEQVSEVRFVEQLPTELVKHDKRVTNEREVTEQVTHALKEGEEYKDLATSDGHILTGEVKRSRAKLKDSPAVSDLTMTHGHDTFSQEDIFLAKFNIANAEEQTLKTDPVTKEIKERKDENVDSPNIIVGTAVTEGQDSGGNDRDQVSTEASSDAGDIEGNDLRRPKPARNDEAAEMFTKTQGDGIAREDNKRPLQNEIPLPLPSTDIGKGTLESEEDDLVHMETFEDENTFVENADNDLPEVQIRLTEQISEAKPSKLVDTELIDIIEDQLGSVNVTAQVTDLLADGENYVKPVKWDKHIFGSDVQQKASKFKSSPDDSEDSDAEAKSHLVVAGKDDATSSEAAYLVKFKISGNVLNPDLTKDLDSVNRNSDGAEDILKLPLKEMPGDSHRKSSDFNWEKDIGDNEFAVEVHDVPALLNISPELETNVVAEASSINTQHFDVEKATQLKDSGSEINDKPPAGVKYEPVNDKSEVILENKDVAEKVMNKDRMKDGTLEFDSNVETKKALGKRSVEPAAEELTVLTAASNSAKDKEGGSQVTSQVDRTEPQLQASSQDVEKVNLNVDVNLEHLVEYPVTNISEAAIEETGKLPEMQEKLMQPKELVRDVAAEGEQEDRVDDSQAGNASLPMEAKAPSQRKDGDLKLEGEASDANKLSIETPMPRESGTKEIVDRHDEQGTDLHAGVKSDEDASDRKVDAMVVDDKKAVGIPTTLDLNRIDATSEKMKQNTTLENNLEMDKNIGNATLNADKGLGVGDKKDKESLVPIDVNKLDATSEKVAQRTTLENNLEVDENIGNITLNVTKSLAGDVRDVVGDTFEENKIGDDVHLEKLNKGEVDSLVEATIGNGKEIGSFKEINPLFKESGDDVKPLEEDEPLQGSMREATETFTPLNRQHAKVESKLAEGNKVPTGDLTTKEDVNKKEITEQVNEKLRAERLAIEDAVTSVNFEISKALADSNVQLKTTLDKKYMEMKESRAAMDSKMKSPNEELTESKGEMEKRDDLRGVSMERSLKVEKKYYSNLVKVNSIEEKLNMMDAESKTPAGSLEPVKETVDTNGAQEENNGKKGQALNEAEIMSTKQAKIVDKEVSNDDAYQSLIHTDPLHKELREKVSEVSKEPVKEDVDPKGIVAKRNEAANEQHFDVKDMDRAGAGLIYSQDEEQLLIKETKSQQIFELKKALTEENNGLAKVLGEEDSEIIDADSKINLEFKKGLVGNNGAIAEASHGHHTLMNPEVKIVEDVKLNEDLKEAALGSEELLKINETAHLLKDVGKNDDLGKDNIGKSNASLTEEDAKTVVDTEKEGPKGSGMLEREKQNKYVEDENEISEAEGKLILAMNKEIPGEDEKLNEALNSEYLEIRDAKAEVNVNKKRLELDEREGKDANVEPEKNENSYVAKPTAADEKNGMLEREKLSNYAEGENEISEAKEKLILAINKGIAGEDERLHDALNSEYFEMRGTKAEMDLNVNKKRLELNDQEGKDANVEPEEANSDAAKPTATEEQSGMLELQKVKNFAEGENEISEAKGKLILAINKGIAGDDERLHIALNSEYLEMRDAKAEMDLNFNKKRWELDDQEEKDVNMEPEEEENLGMAKPTAADEQSGMLEREKRSNYAEGENEISEAKDKLILEMNKGISGEDEMLHDALNSEYLEKRDPKAEMDLNVNKKRLELNVQEEKDANMEPEENENSYVAKSTAADEKNGMLEREKLSNYAEGENEISEAKEKLIVAINKGIAGEDERLHDALNSEYLEMRDTKAEMDLNVNKKRLELNDQEGKDANVEPEKEENSDAAKLTATEEQSGKLERLKLNNFAEGENEISEAKGKLILAINKGIAGEDERLHIALNSEYLEMRDAKAEMDLNVNKKRGVLDDQEEKDLNVEPAEEENLGMAKPTAADEQSGMLEREKLSNYAEGENEISEAKEKLILAINKGIAGEDESLHDALNSEYLEMRDTKAEMDLNVNKKRLELNDQEGKDANVEPEKEANSEVAKLTATEEQSGMLELQKVKNFAEGENEISEAKGKLILAINKGIAGEDERLHIALNSEYLEMRDAKAEMDLNVNKKHFELNDQGEKDVNMEPEEEENTDAAKLTATEEQSGMLELQKLKNFAEGENEISEAKDKLIFAINKAIAGEDERLHNALNSEYLEMRDAKAEMDLNVNMKRLELNDQEEKDLNVELEKEENSDVTKPTATEDQSGMLERQKVNKYAEGENEISEAKGKLILAINKGIAGEDEKLHDALDSEYIGIREAKVQMDLNVVKKPLELNDHGEKDVALELEEILDRTKPSATEKVTEGNYSHKYDVAGTLQKKDVAQDIEIREAAARVRLTMKRALAVDGEVSPADFKGDVAIQKETSQLDSELKNAWYQVDDDLKDEEDFDDGDANDEAEQTVVTKERIKVRLSQSKHGAGIKETQLEKNADHEEDLSGKEGMSEKDVPTKQSTLDVKIREDLKIEQFANKADLEMLAEQGNENVVKSDDLAHDEEGNEEPQEEQVDKEEVDKLEEKDLKGRVELNDDEDFEDNFELEEEEMDPEPADEELYYLDDEEQEDQKPVEEEEDEDKLEAPEDEEVEADVSSSVNVAEDHKQIGNASNDDGDVESDDPLNDFDEELDDDDESDGHRVDDNMTNEMDDLSETELLEDENALASEVGDEIYLETDQSRSDQNISQITTAEDELYPDVLEQMDLGNEQNLSAEDNIMKEEIETLLDVDDAHADEKRRVPTGNSDSENDGSEGPSRKPDDGPPEFEQTVVEDYLSEERQSRLRRILTETKLSLLEDRLRAFERELADSKIRAEGTMEDVEKSLDSVMDRHEGRVLQWLQEVLEDVGKQHEEAEEGQDLEEEEEEAYEERVEVFNDVQDVVFAMRKRFSMSMESVPIAPGAKVKVKVVQDKFSWLPSDKNGTLPDLILRMDSAFLYVRACVLPSLGSLLGMVASQLPAEWRPGPSYHGVPWDVVATGLCLGIAFSLAFLWRLICVFQNRRYLRREARHIQTVKKVLEEKHELAEQLANARKEIHGKASSLQGMLEGSKSSKQAIAKLQTEHRELQESICERRSEMEAIRHSLQSMQQQWEQQNSLKLRLQRSTEGVEQTLGSLKADLEAVLSRVGTANSNNDKMEAKLVKMEKENEQLQRSNRRLEEEVELCDTSVGELTETLRAERQTQKSLEEAVAFKQNEVEAMTACLNQLKDLGVDSESLDESEKRKQKQKLQELMDVSKVNVMLRVVEEEIEEYGSLLRDEVAATHKLEGTLEAYENKNASLAAEKGNLCEELARCKQKLNMVKQMYEEKEVKLQRKLTLEETHREQNKGKLSAVDERVLKAIEDASIHRRKVEDLREELNKTEKNYKDQISTNEKKVHENWLKARTAEREMVASKKEVATLKERMSDIELKLALLHRPPTYQMDFQRGLPLQPLVVPTHRGASLRDGSSFTSSPVSGPPSPPMLTDEPRRGPTRAPGQPRRTPRAADNGPSSPLDSTDGLHNPIPAGRPPELRAPHGHAAPPPGPHEPAYPRHSPPRGQHIPPAQAGPRGGPQTSPLSAQGTPPPSTRAAYGFPQQQRPAGPTAAASASQNGALRGPPGPGLPPPAAPYGPPLSPAPSGGPPPMQRQFYPPPPQGAPGAPAQGQLAPPEPLVPYDSQPSQGRRNPPPPWQGAPGQHPPQGSAGQRPPPQGPPGQPPMLGPPGQHPSQGHPGHPPPQGARGQPPSQGHPGHRPPQGPPGQPPHLYAESQLQHSQAPQSPPLSQAPRMPPPSQGPFAPPPWQGIRGPHPPPSAQGFHGRPSLQELRPQHRLPPPPASSGVRSSAPNSRDK
ncbi:uncharacterized protein LOC116947878 isoform X2 [Petromyzon marinus]|uniref:uncharacterized protein LOC116947878 isoform X2 n=1 Tax=Petromyzon marinus TaxID=7757 RepID=UPI003F70B876